MENAINILIVSDPEITGYGIITNLVTKELKQKYNANICWFMVNNDKTFYANNANGIPCISFGQDFIYGMFMLIKKNKFDLILLIQDLRPWLEQFFRHIAPSIPNIPILYWHLWDSGPFPEFNIEMYGACTGGIMCGSEYTYKLLGERIRGDGLYLTRMPIDTNSFKPIVEESEVKKLKSFKRKICKNLDDFFVIGSVNKNIKRKRLIDIIRIFNKLELNEHKNLKLILKTNPDDVFGTPLKMLAKSDNIIFVPDRCSTEELNMIYNSFDCNINISNAEGLGLSVIESVSAGIPNIVARTGGMTDTIEKCPVKCNQILDIKTSVLGGWQSGISSGWIYDDYIDAENDLYSAIEKQITIKKLTIEERTQMHDYIVQYFGVEKTVDKIVRLIKKITKKEEKVL